MVVVEALAVAASLLRLPMLGLWTDREVFGLLLPLLGLLVVLPDDAARDILCWPFFCDDEVFEEIDAFGEADERGAGAGECIGTAAGAGGEGGFWSKILENAGSGRCGGSLGGGVGGTSGVFLLDSSARRTTSLRALVITPARVTRSRREVVSKGSFSGVAVACKRGEL